MISFTIPIDQASINDVLALTHEGYEINLNTTTGHWEAHRD
jgi:hypothetical protein